MEEEQKILEQAKHLPLEERVVHKSWKARVDLYEELKSKLESVQGSEDPLIS